MKITNIPLILNTSFNKHGLPIVETPHDACQHLEWKCIELLSIEDYLIFPKKLSNYKKNNKLILFLNDKISFVTGILF